MLPLGSLKLPSKPVSICGRNLRRNGSQQLLHLRLLSHLLELLSRQWLSEQVLSHLSLSLSLTHTHTHTHTSAHTHTHTHTQHTHTPHTHSNCVNGDCQWSIHSLESCFFFGGGDNCCYSCLPRGQRIRQQLRRQRGGRGDACRCRDNGDGPRPPQASPLIFTSYSTAVVLNNSLLKELFVPSRPNRLPS